jgi:rare lipoprotein A
MKKQFLHVVRLALIFVGFGLLTASAEEGMGVFYSNHFQGKPTANGGIFDQEGLTAAHKTLAFGTKVKVTNPETNKSVVVTVTDRMARRNSNLIDLTLRAAREIGIEKKGRSRVNVEVQP